MSVGPDSPADGPSGGSRALRSPVTRQRRERGLGSAVGLSVLGALVPGTAFLAAGRRVLGVVTLSVFLLLVGGVVWLATGGRRTVFLAAVDTDQLLWVVAGVAVLTLLWVAVVVAGFLMLVPRGTSRSRRALGALVVAVFVAAIVAPAVWASQLLLTQRELIAGVFDDGRSATVEDTPDPFGRKERVNVLLLGGDGGEGREGVRTDTVIVASIDTDTGETVLLSLPRNLQELPFPEDSALREVYPDGFEGANESDSLLNAVYRTGPAWYPDILGPTDDPGADFLKLGVGEALGLDIDYYVLVNLDGFSRLVDALGGITVNVNYYVPIGGDPGTGRLPDGYIAPGPDQLLDGARALDFARGRFGLTDYDRMARQRCTIDAIIDAANPGTLLRKYQELAATTEDIVSTDIPRSALDDFVDLGLLVKDAEVRSVVFDTSVIDPAYPDYDRIRQIVQDALAPAAAPTATPEEAPAEESTAPPSSLNGEPPAPTTAAAPAADVADACAFDRARAQEALDAGEPPTYGG